MLFLLLGMLLLGKTEDVLSLKMNSLGSVEDFNRTFRQFYRLEKTACRRSSLEKVQ